MTVAKQIDVRDNIKRYFDLAFDGEAIFIPRKDNKNVYVISQKEYEDLVQAKERADYLNMLNHSMEQLASGNAVKLTLEQLRNME